MQYLLDRQILVLFIVFGSLHFSAERILKLKIGRNLAELYGRHAVLGSKMFKPSFKNVIITALFETIQSHVQDSCPVKDSSLKLKPFVRNQPMTFTAQLIQAQELLVEKCICYVGLDRGPGEVLRTIFECVASGLFLPGKRHLAHYLFKCIVCHHCRPGLPDLIGRSLASYESTLIPVSDNELKLTLCTVTNYSVVK